MTPQPEATPIAPTSIAHGMPTGRFLLLWALAWAVIGCGVGAGIVFSAAAAPGPALRISILFAEVIGFTALVSARLIFPMFVRMPFALSLFLQVMTALTGTVFGSIVVVAIHPLFFLNQPRAVALIVAVNGLLAVIVGLALYTYDRMRRQIEQSFEALRRKEALERELSIARDVQQMLLPNTTPQLEGLELAGICIPAIGVGGDYFDFLQFDERHLGLVIADVSGKGIPAALLMAGLQASVRSLARPGVPPGQLNRRLNEILFRSSSASRYATLFLGFYDVTDRSLSYSNAGHHPPLVVGNGRVTSLKAVGGLPIGMFEHSGYNEGSHVLALGDVLALFTDGVVEQPNAEGEEFGERRLIDLLQGLAGRPLDELRNSILDALRSWSGGAPVHDDVTLVLARAR